MTAWTETGARTDRQNALAQLPGRSYTKDLAAPPLSLPADRSQVPAAHAAVAALFS
jgi:hypothetical protein